MKELSRVGKTRSLSCLGGGMGTRNMNLSKFI